jgi:hypothetical protein
MACHALLLHDVWWVQVAPSARAMQSAARSAPAMPDPPNAAFMASRAVRHCPPYARTDTTCAYSCRTTESRSPTGTPGEM